MVNQPVEEASVNDSSMPLLMPKSVVQLSDFSTHEKPFDWIIILQIIYVLGIVFMLIKLLNFLIKILKMNRLRNDKNYISTKGILANSSFLNLIFIDDSELSENEIEQIIAHEKWHIKLYHSYDLLFVEILKIIFWFNPVLWLLQRSLSQVHEYEVDTRMIQAYHPQTYAQLLLKLANNHQRLSMVHQFSRKPLKDRIHFLFTKQKSTPMKRLAYLSILPILGAVFMAFSVEKVVKCQVAKTPDEQYFKVIKKPDAEVNNEVMVKENKVISNLVYGNNRVALTISPNKISGKELDEAAKYFKKIGFNLEMTHFQFRNKSKDLDKIELTLIENKENKKKYRNNKRDTKSDLPSKFMFDLKKMKAKGKGLDYIITILADRSSGEHFVASLAPPPPPPVPPLPPSPPLPPTKRTINITGLIVESATLFPINEVEVYDENSKLLGKTDATGFFNIEFNIVKEGEIKFKLLAKKEGYDKLVQNEHWGDLEGNLNATYYFGLKKKSDDSKAFSELVVGKNYKSYDEVKDGFYAIKGELDFDKRVEDIKKNNDEFFFKIDNDYYLINNSGWIKLNSENDKIIVNGDKIFSAKEINLYVKRSCVRGMSPVQLKNASFEVSSNCVSALPKPPLPPIKVGGKKNVGKSKTGEILINDKLYFYSIAKKDTILYNRFGVQVDRTGQPKTL